MVQEEAQEENEKEVEPKPTLEVVLPNVSQIQSCAIHCPNLKIQVNITEQTLFSLSISKIRYETLYGLFL